MPWFHRLLRSHGRGTSRREIYAPAWLRPTFRGQPLRIHAEMAALACGVHYRLTQHLDLGTTRELLQGAQAEVPWVWTMGTEMLLQKTVSPDVFAWMVPLQNGHTRAGVMRGCDARDALRQLLDRTVP